MVELCALKGELTTSTGELFGALIREREALILERRALKPERTKGSLGSRARRSS